MVSTPVGTVNATQHPTEGLFLADCPLESLAGHPFFGSPARVRPVRDTLIVADWSPLRQSLEKVETSLTLTWSELDAVVGGLPPSAYSHPAFWKGARSQWRGFAATNVQVGHQVTFVRKVTAPGGSEYTIASARTDRDGALTSPPRPAPALPPDIVLVSCVKDKLDRPAPAKDLYTSDLFRKERAYAERVGVSWFILSAEHGLVRPDELLSPYNLRLSETSTAYRRAWGARVVKRLEEVVGALAGKKIEVHAGEAYAGPIRALLRTAGAEVMEPLRGLAFGQRLSWYLCTNGLPPAPTVKRQVFLEAAELLTELRDESRAVTPGQFLATGGSGLRSPGLYSWWVDEDGAFDLSRGLGNPVPPGLIYAGLAGATRSRSRKRSKNTLWGRIRSMHLGGRHQFSTFRRSLGSVLAGAFEQAEIDENSLTQWMHWHLRVVTIPVEDPDALGHLETLVLRDLDPPLNLDKVPKTALRQRLTELRRQYSRKR
jgi:hypothetical protein